MTSSSRPCTARCRAWAGPARRRPPAARPATAGSRWQALIDQATEFARTPGSTLGDFVDDLDRRAAEQHAPVADGVTLATFHAAKGLEWDSVFLCGLQDGTLPITYADTPAAVEEERRLLYVGMTRARVDLALSWAAGPQPRRSGLTQAVPLPRPRCCPQEARAEREPAAQPQGGQLPRVRQAADDRGGEEAGRCEDCPASYDEALFERLREWRKERAGEESVPAFVVFTDATLQLIAEHKPRTPEALLRISGIGRSKVEKYGEDVLALVG